MHKNEVRKSLRLRSSNPAGAISTELAEGVSKTMDMNTTRESLTISIGCGTFLTIWCC